MFWQLGSLNGSRWEQVGVAAPFMVVGLVAAMAMSRRLDLLALGDRAARHVGVDVERLRMGAIVVVALLTAAAVAFCGIIAFVGLVVPHLVRLLAGPGHRLLVPASALGGALLLVVADLRVPITMVSVAVALALTGWTSARLGYGPPGRAVLRNVGGGVFAMVVTFLVGSALGTTIG